MSKTIQIFATLHNCLLKHGEMENIAASRHALKTFTLDALGAGSAGGEQQEHVTVQLQRQQPLQRQVFTARLPKRRTVASLHTE